MASREISKLSHEMQVLYNKLFDKCRRDTEMLKHGISILLTCTARNDLEREKLGERGKSKISHTPSEAFEIVVLKYGTIVPMADEVVAHAASVGLMYNGKHFEETK